MRKTLIVASLMLLVQMAVGQTCKDTIPASTPDSRFIVNGDEVTDTATGLIWQRCSLGQTENDCSGGSANAYYWPEALQAASPPWRLPSINELESIVEEKCYAPAINLVIFPNTSTGYWWSASPYAYNSINAWFVSFGYGGSGGTYKGYGPWYVRLVRDGQ